MLKEEKDELYRKLLDTYEARKKMGLSSDLTRKLRRRRKLRRMRHHRKSKRMWYLYFSLVGLIYTLRTLRGSKASFENNSTLQCILSFYPDQRCPLSPFQPEWWSRRYGIDPPMILWSFAFRKFWSLIWKTYDLSRLWQSQHGRKC